MRVLIVVDRSEESSRAVESTRRRSWPVGTRFTVLGVASRFNLPAPPASMYAPGLFYGRGRSSGAAKAGVWVALAVNALRSAGLEAEGKVRVGNRRKAIVAEALSMKADRILLGSVGSSPLWRILPDGRLIAALARKARCAVEVLGRRQAAAMA